MRESSFTIQPQGLAAEPTAIDGLVTLRNLKPENGFWSVPVLPTIPTGWGADCQVFRGSVQTLLCSQTEVSGVNESNYSLTSLVDSITPGDGWQFADFGPVWVLTDGTTVVYRIPDHESQAGEFLTDKTTGIGAVAVHYGTRLLYGNTAKGQNYVGWSMTDGRDLRHILTGEALPEKWVRLNEADGMLMPWRGKVLAILPMRDKFVVYGEDGISCFQVRGGSYGLDWLNNLPVGVGIAGRCCVAGNDDQHVFVGSDGSLYTFGPDMTVTRLNRGILPAITRVSYEPTLVEFWLAGASASYVLTKSGLGGPIDARIMSIACKGNESIATGTGYPAQIITELWTNIFDTGQNAQKRITFVRVSADGMSGMFAAAKIGFGTATKQ